MPPKLISVVTTCYNEEDNVRPFHEAVRRVFASLPQYGYELIFSDNASRDRTAAVLKDLARTDPNVKVILNTRNFGQIRSSFNGFLQARGEAAIVMACDFQEPPELIPDFLRKWEEGYRVALGVKSGSGEPRLMSWIRNLYYDLISRLADVELIKNATGFGLYDRKMIEIMRGIDDPYPYVRGLISDIGFETARIPYRQPRRERGVSKHRFFALYEVAMLGIVNHSKVPLRLATMGGFVMGGASLLAAFGYLAAKLLYWDRFTVGIAPILISLFFFSSLQLFFIGIMGEYIGSIHTQVQKRPLVIEKERINFT